jgi:vitamin B12 transporter
MALAGDAPFRRSAQGLFMFRAFLLSSVALCATLTTAHAQTTPVVNGDTVSADLEEIVVTANRTPTPAKAVGSAVTVITREELEQRQVRLVSDALRSVPGVAVNRGGVLGAKTQVRIRGSEGNQTLVLLDGVELNDPSADSEYDFANLLVQDVERIEVLRGPQSALYGSDAVGGVINIITRRGEGKPRLSAFAEGGTRNTAAGGASISGKEGRFDFLVSAQGLRTDGFSTASEWRGFSEKDGYENGTAFAKFGFQALDNLRFDFVGRGTDFEGESDDDFGNGPFDSDAGVDGKQFFGRAQAKLDLMDGRWEHILGASRSHLETRFLSAGDPTYENVGDKTKLDYQTSFSYRSDALPDLSHKATFAAEHEEDEATTDSSFSSFDRSISQTGLVGQYQLGVWDDLFLTGSVRHDQNDLFGDHTTYRLTGAYTFEATGTKLRASYGTGIKNPTLFELYGSTPTYNGNADLEPEKARGWDVGVDQSFLDNRLLLEATYFNQRIEDLIQGSGQTSNNLDGTSRVDGVELAVSASPMENVTLRAAYTWTNGENPTGEELLRRPEHIASLDVNYSFLQNRANLNLGVVYNGDQQDSVFGLGTVNLEEYVLINLRGGYKVTENAEIYGRLENLLDEEYEEVYGYGSLGRTAIIGARVNF